MSEKISVQNPLMKNIEVVDSKFEFLDKILSDINLENKIVLDAGTGGGSARFLAQKGPKKIICVAGPGDKRKEISARSALESIGYKNYQIILRNLICADLFHSESFDFILADYLIDELGGFAPLGIYDVLNNLYRFLRKGSELVIINPETYISFQPRYDTISMGEIHGDAQLKKRNNRDLIDAVNVLFSIVKKLKLLYSSVSSPTYSKWICKWLTDAGFKELKTYFFDIKRSVNEEFTQCSRWCRQRILSMCPPKLQEGLLEKLEEIISEYNGRDVNKDDFFLQKDYIIRAKKLGRNIGTMVKD